MAVNRYLDNTILAEKLHVASGQMLDTSFIHKFGAVPAMSINQTGTVWDVSDTLYPWSSFNSAGPLSIPAVNASDNAHEVTIIGLDENYNDLSETVTVSSSGATTTTNSFIRVYRAFDETGTNVANINIQKGGVTAARITAGFGQTLMSIYTVPKGKTGYLMKGTMTVQDGGNGTGHMYIRYPNQTSFRVGHSFEVSSGGPYHYEFSIPIKLPAMTDIDVRAIARGNNSRLTAAFDIILVDN